MYQEIQALEKKIQPYVEQLNQLKLEIHRAVIGQERMIDRLLIGLFSGGHILLEGLPGLAKTLTVNSLAKTLNVEFKRIQFTPDMLPADLIGTNIFIPNEGIFKAKKGPIFSNIVLADEINRAPAKVQSALLEAMQEKQVTLGNETYPLSDPFLVLATQNPIEQEGTYPLPEAQLDRFMMKVKVEYPSKDVERKILDQITEFGNNVDLQAILQPTDILEARKLIREVYLDGKIKDYIVSLVDATRNPEQYGLNHLKPLIEVAASPRASIALAIASRTVAFMNGKGFVTPHEIKVIAHDVLRHRILLSYEAEAEEKTTEYIIDQLLAKIPVP
ncbi:MAG: MoxR-like ATPase, partial [bacterium]